MKTTLALLRPLIYWILQHFILLISLLGITTLALGIHGFLTLESKCCEITFWNALYGTLSLTVLEWSLNPDDQVPLTLNIARFLAPVVSGGVVAKGISFLAGFHNKIHRDSMNGHRIVCGLGQRGQHLAVTRARDKKNVVAIDANPSPEIETVCQNNGINLVAGDASDISVLKEAGITRAKEAYIFTDNDNLNLEIVHAIQKARRNVSESDDVPELECYLSVNDLHLTDLIAVHSDYKECGAKMDVQSFNDYQTVARGLWKTLLKIAAKEGRCLPVKINDTKRPHIVLVGFSPAAEAIAQQIANQAHFANDKETRMTIIDEAVDQKDAAKANNLVAATLEKLDLILDLKKVPAKPGSLEAQAKILDALDEGDSLPTIIVSGREDSENLRLALHINGQLGGVENTSVPIFVRLKESTGLDEFIDREVTENAVLKQVHGFGLYQETFSLENIKAEALNDIAQAIHASFYGDGHKPSDPQVKEAWDDLPEYLKEANRNPAEHIAIKCLAIGCDISAGGIPKLEDLEANIEILARMEHARWMADKKLQGWKWGEETNKQRLTHKNLVPWEDLPEEEKEKDRDQVRAIPDLLKAARGSA